MQKKDSVQRPRDLSPHHGLVRGESSVTGMVERLGQLANRAVKV